jgi:hypothetical protein
LIPVEQAPPAFGRALAAQASAAHGLVLIRISHRQMSNAGAEVEPTFPYPPRFRWMKRGIVAGLLLVVPLVIVRVCWGWSMQKRLSEAHAHVRARGTPLVAEDLNAEPPVLPKKNAAAYYGSAVRR